MRRIEVSALEAGAQPAWIVFALTNDSDEQLTRLVVAPHFRFVGSGVVSPDLGSSRITTITASQGSPPEREDQVDADVFRLTLDPGTTVTYVAELRTPSLPQLYLWEPDAYKDNGASLTLYQGILIGIAGLLALFLTSSSSSRAPWCSPRRRRWPGRCSPMSASTLVSGARFSALTTKPSASGAPASRRP